jgi:tape measure domain-containing protein
VQLFELYASLGLNDAKFNTGIANSRAKFASFASSVGSGVGKITSASSKVISTMSSIVTRSSLAIAGIGGVMAKIGLSYNQQMEDYTNNFTVMLGSAEAGIEKVEELKKFAASTPFSMADLASSTQTLLAFNVSADKSTDIMRMLGDVALGNADKFSRLSIAYGKANSLGKLTGEVYQQMVEAGFNPLNVIAQETGESMEQLQKRMAAGKISVQELERAFQKATGVGGQFYKGMESASKTTSGLISTLKDNATALVGKILTPLSDWVRDELLPNTIGYVDEITSALDEGADETKSTITRIFRNLLTDSDGTLKKVFSKVQSFFGNMFDVVDDLMPDIIRAGSDFIGNLFAGMQENMPRIAEIAGEIVPMIITAIFTFKAQMLQSGIEIIASIAEGLAANVGTITAQVSNIVSALLNTISTSLPSIIDSGLEILVAILKGLSENTAQISETITTVITSLITYLSEHGAEIIQAGFDILLAIADGIIDAIADPEFPKKIQTIIDTLIAKLKDNWPAIEQAGIDLMSALWKGIASIGKQIGYNAAVAIINKLADVFGTPKLEMANGGVYLSGYYDENRVWHSHATGLERVPYDNYKANLHEGEAVLTKAENRERLSGDSGTSKAVTVNQTVNINGNDLSYADTQRAMQKANNRLREALYGY